MRGGELHDEIQYCCLATFLQTKSNKVCDSSTIKKKKRNIITYVRCALLKEQVELVLCRNMPVTTKAASLCSLSLCFLSALTCERSWLAASQSSHAAKETGLRRVYVTEIVLSVWAAHEQTGDVNVIPWLSAAVSRRIRTTAVCRKSARSCWGEKNRPELPKLFPELHNKWCPEPVSWSCEGNFKVSTDWAADFITPP